MNKKKHSPLFQELILKSWWTILFLLICVFAYDQAVQRRTREEKNLQAKLDKLLLSKEATLAKQANLKLQIMSQGDPAFIEMALMRRLGLVPEGQTKIHFIQREP